MHLLITRLFSVVVLMFVWLLPLGAVGDTPLQSASMPVSGALVPDFTLTAPPSPPRDHFRLKIGAKKAMLTQMALTPAWFQLGIAFHEGMHAVPCAVMSSCIVEKYRPFPGWQDSPTYGRLFYFGWVDTDIIEGEKLSATQRTMLDGGPLAGNVGLFLIGDTLLSTVISSDSRAAPFVLTGMMIVPYVDFLRNVTNVEPYTDFSWVARDTGWNKDAMVLASLAIAGVGAWRIVRHTKEIFFEKEKEKRY